MPADKFAASVKVSELNATHAEYAANVDAWVDIDLLYRGGHQIRRQASKFLVRRPKELHDVFSARLERFTYQNCIGTGLGWYEAALFEKPPEVDTRPEAGGEGEPAKEIADFYEQFLGNCDRAGTKFKDFWIKVFRGLALFRCAYVLTDLPLPEQPPVNLKQQKDLGLLNPYLVYYSPANVLNWETDRYGNLEWVVVYTKNENTGFLGAGAVIERWYYFNLEQYAVYERLGKAGEKAPKEIATLQASGLHALAKVGRVPLRRIEVSDGLWIGNRALPQAIEHVNADNQLGFALMMAALAMPVIITDDDLTQPTISEVGYFKLTKGSDFKWTEPAGTSFAHLQARIGSLREEIYRQMYLQAQGRSTEAAPAVQSGFSKEVDMRPAANVLSAYGDRLLSGMALVLEDVAAVRGDNVEFEVRGFHFSTDGGPEEIRNDQSVKDFGVQSDTFHKELQKRVVRRHLPDAEAPTIDAIMDEIDKAPTLTEIEAEEKKLQEQSMASSLSGV